MTQQYKVFDNFLEEEVFDKIKNTFISPNFPWYFSDTIDYADESDNIEKFQFTHVLYNEYQPNSSYFSVLKPLIEKINPSSILRIKLNLLVKTEEIKINNYHADYDFDIRETKARTAVYYLNTNNGKTIFEDGTEVESIENRLLIFNPNLQHTGTSCTNQKSRVVINLNYYQW